MSSPRTLRCARNGRGLHEARRLAVHEQRHRPASPAQQLAFGDDPQVHAVDDVSGSVQSCVIVKDAETGSSKGFGFVEMPKSGDAKAALHQLNGKELDGEYIRGKRAT